MSCRFFPALDKAGWREAPGWFEAVIPQLVSDSYKRAAPQEPSKNRFIKADQLISKPIFITKAMLRNYKSIGYCDVSLGKLTYLVGANGSGKSNFLDALHLVRDALSGSLDNALNERGGLSEVRRRSSGHPTHFGIRLEFTLATTGQPGYYAFTIAALAGGGYEVLAEKCVIQGTGKGTFFQIDRGCLQGSSCLLYTSRCV